MLLAVLFTGSHIDDAVRLVMRTQQVAGLSIGISHNGRAVYERGYGWRDLGHRLPARPDTIYRIGSLTKTFTAAAILQLARQGKLSLRDPAAMYLTSFPWPHAITVEQLLTHQSGIPSYSDVESLDRHREYTPGQLVDAAATLPLLFEPGTQWSYSNTNYVLLGMIVEHVSGVPYPAYLQSAILAPLQLRDTSYGDEAGEARGYARDALNSPVAPSSISFGYAAAAMSSNVPDLLSWLTHASEPYYGFFESHMYGEIVVYAIGNVNGYSSVAMIAPQKRDAIVILTNAGELDLIPLAKSVFAAIVHS